MRIQYKKSTNTQKLNPKQTEQKLCGKSTNKNTIKEVPEGNPKP
jgi:hypothetical protein